ncbi:hypothetical protein C8Q76DRAFT_763831 [Earliella scabrosa]|nr:hypothetical protein C8Q76DRAFT_763831 [Earliella scabrosa]
MKFTVSVLLAAAAFAGVHAQSSTDTATGTAAAPAPSDVIAGIPPCLLGCITESATSAGCSGITDVVCFCTNTDFQASALACFQSECTPEEAEAATALQAQQCGAAVSDGGDDTTPTPTTTGSNTATGADATPTTTGAGSENEEPSETPNAAAPLKVGFGGVLGVVAGAALFL